MAKKTIAVDIDDVLAISASNFLDYSNSKWGTRLTIDDFDEDWAAMWKIDREAEIERAKQVIDDKVFNTHKHFEEATPVLRKLVKNFKLVVATSRTKTIAGDTLEWIEKHFPGIFAEVHYAGIWDDMEKRHEAYKKTKADLAKQIGADYLIDDQPKHCIAAADVGITTLLFGDYPWNRHAKLSNGVARVHDWSEIEKYFYGQQN